MPLVIHGTRSRPVAAGRLSLEARRMRGSFGTKGQAMAVRRFFGGDAPPPGISLASSMSQRAPMANRLRTVLAAGRPAEEDDSDAEPIQLPEFDGPTMLCASVSGGVTFHQLLHHEMSFKLLTDKGGKAVAADEQMLAAMRAEAVAASVAKSSTKGKKSAKKSGGKKKSGAKKKGGAKKGGKKKK